MITRYECPITECGWHHDRPDPEMTAADWRGTISASIEALMIREYMDADKIVGAHLATHTTLQWATEINAWRTRAEQAERELATIVGAWRGIDDFNEAMRRFHETTGTAQADVDSIKARLLAVADDMQKAGNGNA